MIVSINFPAEIGATLRHRAAAAGTDVETIIRELITERLAEEVPLPAKVASHADFMARLHRIIDLHPMSNGSMDDGRASIYHP